MCWMCDQDARSQYTSWAYNEMFGDRVALARLHFAQAEAARATDAMWQTGHENGPAQPPFLILIGDTVPGDTSSTATLTVGAPHTIGTTETIGDQDFYRVELVAGTTYEIGMYAYTGGPGGIPQADAYVEIRDAGGNLIVSGDGGAHTLYNNLNSGFDVLLTFTPEVSGLFFVNARAYDNDPVNGTTGDTVGDYELFVQVQPAGGYTPYYDVDSPLYSIDWGTQVDGTSRNPDGAEGPRPTGNEFTGHAWNPYGITGKNVITYYFARQGEVFIDEDPTTPGTTDTIIASGFEQWEKDVYLNAFGAYSKVADIVYVEVQDRTDADFVLITYEGTPGPGVSLLGRMSPPDEENEGRTEFNANDQRWTEAGLAPGGFSFTTLIHELGHGHGLAHPHDNGGHSGIMHGVEPEGVAFDYTNGDFDLNQSVYTMMSYEDGWQKSPYGQPSTNDPYGWLGSLMAFDVAAIQDKYGVNEEWATGNDTYVLNDVNAPGTFYSCIWDADGTDAIVYSGARNANIDLRAASLLYEFGGGGWISYAFGIHGGFTIANGVTIENATSGSGNDTLIGNGAANVLNGGAGIDTMTGNAGNDVYIVDNAADAVVELAGGGTNDSVFSSVSYGLAAGVDVEYLSTIQHVATTAINLTGNSLGQEIVGNNGNNVLIGGGGSDRMVGFGGDDLYVVDDFSDVVQESLGQGNDSVYATASYALTAGAEVEYLSTIQHSATNAINLTGNALNQQVVGNNGANILIGGGGTDRLVGFGGDDLYVVDDASDVLQEEAGQGNDSAYASASYALAEGVSVEYLSTLQHSATTAINLTGNSLGQEVVGNQGSNTLSGKGGNDILVGFGGADTFVFDTALGAGNVDQVRDFVSGVDHLALESDIFSAIGSALDAGELRIGAAAADADDRIIYDPTTGALYYDADGSGAGAAVQFAQLSTGLSLVTSDFAVI